MMTVTIIFSEPPTVEAWCRIVEAVANAYPTGAVMREPTGEAHGLTTVIEVTP
jgi:hypothetical protein